MTDAPTSKDLPAALDATRTQLQYSMSREIALIRKLASLALVCEVKDDALTMVRDACLYTEDDGIVGITTEPTIDITEFKQICDALAVKPDDDILADWLGDPVGYVNAEDMRECHQKHQSAVLWGKRYTPREDTAVYVPKGTTV